MREMLENPSGFSGHELQLMRDYGGSEPNPGFHDSVVFDRLMRDVIEPWAARSGFGIVHI